MSRRYVCMARDLPESRFRLSPDDIIETLIRRKLAMVLLCEQADDRGSQIYQRGITAHRCFLDSDRMDATVAELAQLNLVSVTQLTGASTAKKLQVLS